MIECFMIKEKDLEDGGVTYDEVGLDNIYYKFKWVKCPKNKVYAYQASSPVFYK